MDLNNLLANNTNNTDFNSHFCGNKRPRWKGFFRTLTCACTEAWLSTTEESIWVSLSTYRTAVWLIRHLRILWNWSTLAVLCSMLLCKHRPEIDKVRPACLKHCHTADNIVFWPSCWHEVPVDAFVMWHETIFESPFVALETPLTHSTVVFYLKWLKKKPHLFQPVKSASAKPWLTKKPLNERQPPLKWSSPIWT